MVPPTPSASTDSWLKVIAFGCTHMPISDPKTVAWRSAQVEEYQPEVIVHLGDWLDADAASRWPNEHDWTLKDEYRAVADDMRHLQKLVPKAKRVWLLGNHDDNLRAPNRIPKKLREVCSWEQDPDMQAAITDGDWKIVPYSHRAMYRIGQVTFQHGAQTNLNAERDQCLLYGVQHGLHVSAHLHRPREITRVVLPGKVPLPYWYANVGCEADWSKMEYVQRASIALWGSGLMKLRINAAQRRSSFASVQWAADPGLVLYKMAHG